MSRPKTGTNKISNSQAMAEEGLRRSGTNPMTMTLIATTRTQTRIVAITAVTRFEHIQRAWVVVLSRVPAEGRQGWVLMLRAGGGACRLRSRVNGLILRDSDNRRSAAQE